MTYIKYFVSYSDTVSNVEKNQVASVDWSVLSPPGVFTLLELSCKMFAKVSKKIGTQCVRALFATYVNIFMERTILTFFGVEVIFGWF